MTGRYRDDVVAARAKSGKIFALWKDRDAKELDTVYSSLLKAGSSAAKRHYELTGNLADAEAVQNPMQSRLQAPLQALQHPTRGHVSTVGPSGKISCDSDSGSKVSAIDVPAIDRVPAALAQNAPTRI